MNETTMSPEMAEVRSAIEPLVVKLTAQLKEDLPDIDAQGASNIVASNIWAEIERKMREEFERDLHGRALEFIGAVSSLTHELWDRS